LKVEKGYLLFTVKNPVEENIPTANAGIGLKNAKRRLELLYGNNYRLDFSEKQNEFIVSLKMPVC